MKYDDRDCIAFCFFWGLSSRWECRYRSPYPLFFWLLHRFLNFLALHRCCQSLFL